MNKQIKEWDLSFTPTVSVIEDLFSTKFKKGKKGVVSKNTAADLWGFSEIMTTKPIITYPKGYNPNNNNIKMVQRNADKYNFQAEVFRIGGTVFSVYSPERTIVEIIKDAKDKITDVVLKTIKNFFDNIKYSSTKLYEAARKFNIEKVVKVFESTMKNG